MFRHPLYQSTPGALAHLTATQPVEAQMTMEELCRYRRTGKLPPPPAAPKESKVRLTKRIIIELFKEGGGRRSMIAREVYEHLGGPDGCPVAECLIHSVLSDLCEEGALESEHCLAPQRRDPKKMNRVKRYWLAGK